MTDPVEELTLAVAKILEDSKLSEAISFERNEDRCWWDRRVGGVARHIRITPVDGGTVPWTYSILFGQSTGAGQTNHENFDARRWGTLEDAVAYLRMWLIEWVGLDKMGQR